MMTRDGKQPHDEQTAAEARHVAEDAVEAAEDGNLKEARFLAREAEALDSRAAHSVLDAHPIPPAPPRAPGEEAAR